MLGESSKINSQHNSIFICHAEPLSKLREETAQLQHTLQVYTTELQQITKVKEACRKQEKLFQDLSLHREVLQQQLIQLQKEKEALSKEMDAAVLQLHRKRTLENTVLEKKLAYLKEAVEVANTQELHARTLDAFLGALHASGLATEDLGVHLLEGTQFDIKRQPQIQIKTS
ncbi:hypothetical protein ACSSS7_002627 [Eimeria intestinalis]